MVNDVAENGGEVASVQVRPLFGAWAVEVYCGKATVPSLTSPDRGTHCAPICPTTLEAVGGRIV